MKTTRLLAAIAAVSMITLAAPGCAEIAKAVPAFGAGTIQASTLDDRALAEAEAGYNVAIHSYNVANRAGLVSVALKAKLKPLLAKAHTVRKAAEAAFDAGNASDLNTQVAALQAVVAQIKRLVPVQAK